VINSSHNSYQLLSSGANWNSSWFHKDNFIDIDEWRDRQLKKLGIE
jgi:hypothetical protein